MKHSTLLFASSLVAAAAGLLQTGTISCPDGYMLLGSACYFVSEDTHSGASAEDFCQGHGGHAAVIESPEEMDLLKGSLLDQTVLLGVTAPMSREKLFDMSLRMNGHSGYTNFHTGEPNNDGGEDCVIAESALNFAWEDVQCTYPYHVLCKAEATVAQAPCPEGAYLYQNSACFWLDRNQTYTWHDALSACSERGLHLASVHSQLEQDFIWGLSYDKHLWIGLNDLASEGDYVWSDGSAVDYTNWHSGQPNGADAQNCAIMVGVYDGEWGDYPCSNTHGVVCRGVPN